MAALALIPVASKFQGILNVPMFELPWTMPAEVNTSWAFNRGDTWPIIQKMRRTNAASNPYLIELEAYIGNSFTTTYAKFPTANSKWSDLYQTSTQGPIFVYDRLWGLIANNTSQKWYDYFMPAFSGLLNSVSATLPRRQIWDYTNDHRGVGESAQGTTGLIIARQQLPNPVTLGMAKFTADSFGGIRVFGRQYFDDYVFYDNLWDAVSIAGFNPLYNLPDVDGYRNYMVNALNAAYPNYKRPTISQFQGGGNMVFDASALFTSIYFDDFTANELNQLFDASVNAGTATAFNNTATFIHKKHVWSTNIVNSRTPNQNFTTVAVSMDGTKYWLLQFIPQDANAAKVIGDSVVHDANVTFATDPAGNLYMGNPVYITGTQQIVLSSKGFYFPFDFPTPKLYGLSVPCYGSCLPAMIKSQQI